MKAFCSYCNQKFEIDELSFLLLFNTQRRVFCRQCANKETIGCYNCENLDSHWIGDHCLALKDEYPIYCDKYKEKELKKP